MAKGELSFEDQLKLHLDNVQHRRVTISLLSGDRYVVDSRASVTFFPRFVVILPGDRDTDIFFPFEAICNVEVEYMKK